MRIPHHPAIVLIASLPWAGPAAAASGELLNNGSFEVGMPSGDLPTGAGFWGIDGGSFVGPSAGIEPFDQNQMLRFDSTIPACNPLGNGLSGDIGQLVDATAISAGNVKVLATAWFNRVGEPAADTEFQLTMRYWAELPQDVFDDCTPDGWILVEDVVLISDADPETWEQLSIESAVPSGTNTIEVILSVFENVSNNAPPNEFEGHFADLATLRLVPACAEDLNADGSVSSADLNIVLGAFGCTGGACAGDINGDGETNSTDLNLLLAAFGDGC